MGRSIRRTFSTWWTLSTRLTPPRMAISHGPISPPYSHGSAARTSPIAIMCDPMALAPVTASGAAELLRHRCPWTTRRLSAPGADWVTVTVGPGARCADRNSGADYVRYSPIAQLHQLRWCARPRSPGMVDRSRARANWPNHCRAVLRDRVDIAHDCDRRGSARYGAAPYSRKH